MQNHGQTELSYYVLVVRYLALLRDCSGCLERIYTAYVVLSVSMYEEGISQLGRLT